MEEKELRFLLENQGYNKLRETDVVSLRLFPEKFFPSAAENRTELKNNK